MGILPLVIAVLLGGAVIMVFVGLAIPRSSDQVQARLAEYGTRTRTLEEIELEQPFSERVIQPIFRGIAGTIKLKIAFHSLRNVTERLKASQSLFV